VEEMREVLLAGAEKVSVNSQAVRDPDLIRKGAALYGSQMRGACHGRAAGRRDALGLPGGHRRRKDPNRPGRAFLARRAEDLGAGEIVLNSIDADGTGDGYEINGNARDLGGRRYPGGCLRRPRASLSTSATSSSRARRMQR